MRIIAGSAGGRRILAPPQGTRPTTDRVREALFSSLDSHVSSHPGGWGGVRMLDLFAGSGAVGLEAMSRGAASVTLVEHDRRVLEVLRRNVAVVDPRANVVAADAFAWRPTGDPYDIVFVDPPYSVPDEKVRDLLAGLIAQGILTEGALIVVERSQRSGAPWPADHGDADHVDSVRKREYGDTVLWYGLSSHK